MDAFAQVALMAKAKLVFESESTFLSFPVLSPLTYPPERLKFANPTETTAQDLSDISEFARITNRIPQGILAPVEDEDHLWDVYAEVLVTAQVAVDAVVSADEQARYDEAMRLLYTQSPEGFRQDGEALKAYKRLRDAHIKAQEEYKNRQLTGESSQDTAVRAQWTQDEPRLRETVDQLLEEWRTAGRKAQVEAAQQVEEVSAARAPSLMWGKWKKSFIEDIDLSTDTNLIQYALTGFSPYDLFDHGDWPCFNLTNAEMMRLASEAPAELTNIFGSGGATSDIESVSFEYRSVGLTRPWLRPALFRSRFWRLGAEGGELSDGGQPPKGRCPSYVTGLVFARNVTIHRQRQGAKSEAREFLLRLDASTLKRLRGLQRLGSAEGPHDSAAARARRPRPALTFAPLWASRAAFTREKAATQLVGHAFAEKGAVPLVPSVRIATQVVAPIVIRRPSAIRVPPMVIKKSALPVEPSGASNPDITILAFICKRLPRCPDPDPTLIWSTEKPA